MEAYMKLNSFFNQVPDNLTRRALWKIQEGINDLDLSVQEGEIYYVENNAGSDSNDGKTWDTAFKTLAVAVTASNANIAASSKGWAARNKIYYKADSETVNLAAIPAKCDVIGVGSCDAYPMASIKGNHAPLTAMYGCMFYNVRFKPAADGVLWTLIANNNGIGFYGCQFVGAESGKTTSSAISTTATELLTISGCDFDGAFSADVIAIGAGNASGLKIVGNNIRGAANDGIVIDTGATYTNINGPAIIKGNTIQCAGCTIKDVPDSAIVTQNDLISAAATGTASLDINIRLAARNWITDATKGALYPGEH
jgi:uncharacterized protein YjbI with pentapeptide repeats